MSRLPAPQVIVPPPPPPRPGGRAWRPELRAAAGPVYRAIVDVMETDIAAGRLGLGARLPSQRTLARSLGVNLTTVTRAMREAARRGLVIGATGSGTFVARPDRVPDWPGPADLRTGADFVDLSLNYPPDVVEPALGAALAGWAGALARRPQECRSLLPYRTAQGAPADRAAAAAWLADRGLTVDPSRVMITQGAQHGLALGLAALARPGDGVLCEELVYPGLRAVAATAGIRLIPVAMDEEGLRPAALREALRRHTPRALVCTLTFQNPTGAVASLARRQELATTLRRSGIWIIEDDMYAALAEAAPPPLASLLPERTIHVTSLSKTVAPGLRVGYVVAPDAAVLEGLLGALRASVWMTAPILAAIASSWIREGVAQRAVRQIRSELARRHRLLRQTRLPALEAAVEAGGDQRAPHLWVPLASAAAEAGTVALLAERGVGVMGGDAFRIGAADSHGIRICLGAARSVKALKGALGTINDVLERGDGGRGRLVL